MRVRLSTFNSSGFENAFINRMMGPAIKGAKTIQLKIAVKINWHVLKIALCHNYNS